MKIIRRTSLFALYPVVDFSFTREGIIYTLVRREVSQRTDRYTLVLRKKGTRHELKRHFTFNQLRTTFVCLRDDPAKSLQPSKTVCLTVNTF
jgi:hypothetical protein